MSKAPAALLAPAGSVTVRVPLSARRRLTAEISGDDNGYPVFLLHGTPGSRHGPKPRASVLSRLGVRLIAYDRPGYGGSTRQRGRRVAAAARDVTAIANHLGVDRFAVVGRSGGGPHALACAALLGNQVTRTAVLVGVAPANAPGLAWFDGMTDENVREFSAASTDADLLIKWLKEKVEETRQDPRQLLTRVRSQMTDWDKQVVDDVTIQRLLTETYDEALRTGPHGWIDDVLAVRSDWGFPLESVQVPVLLWHGAEDNFSPASHTRWLATRLRTAEVRVEPGAAHFGAVEILPEVLAWLVSDTPAPSTAARRPTFRTGGDR